MREFSCSMLGSGREFKQDHFDDCSRASLPVGNISACVFAQWGGPGSLESRPSRESAASNPCHRTEMGSRLRRIARSRAAIRPLSHHPRSLIRRPSFRRFPLQQQISPLRRQGMSARSICRQQRTIPSRACGVRPRYPAASRSRCGHGRDFRRKWRDEIAPMEWSPICRLMSNSDGVGWIRCARTRRRNGSVLVGLRHADQTSRTNSPSLRPVPLARLAATHRP